jgi:hypothetical protein
MTNDLRDDGQIVAICMRNTVLERAQRCALPGGRTASDPSARARRSRGFPHPQPRLPDAFRYRSG